MKYIIPLGVALLSQFSWPVSYALRKFNLMSDQMSVFVAGILCLTLATAGPILLFRRYFNNVDPLMYVFSVFCWTCMIDLGIALELDGYITDFIGFYFAEGEPYLRTAHGTLINYWDGTTHFALCLAMVGLYASRKSYREVGLYWAGSIINSLIVLVPGGLTGKHPFKLSIMLNVPYLVLPVLAAAKFLRERPPQSRTFLKYPSLWKRPVDLVFVIYYLASIAVAMFRGLTVLGGNASAMKEYLNVYEPYMKDPTNFPLFQILAYEYFFLAYYGAAIYGLISPGQHWMTDWSLIHAGAAAQAQFSYVFGSIHHRTAKSLHSPMSGVPGATFWTINVALFIVPQLFAWWCWNDYEKFGRTYGVHRADLKVAVNKRSKTPNKKLQ